MSDYLKSMLRNAVQLGWGAVAVWLVHHNMPLSNNVSNWVVDGGVSLVILATMALIRWLEERKGTGVVSVYARAIGRVLMLGIGYTPSYPEPAAVPPASSPAQPSVMP